MTSTRAQRLKPSYIREILQATQQPEMISFAGGLPDASLFPMAQLGLATTHLANDRAAFQYGVSAGLEPLRDWIKQHHHCGKNNDVLITTGSQQALDLIARTYLNPGDTVLVESPSYLGALQVFQLAEAQIILIPQTDSGIDTALLAKLIDEHQPKLFYAVPDFHNPTGSRWPAETRQQVARILSHSHTRLIEDAPYAELNYDGEWLPSVTSLCTGPYFFLSSFSKTVTPGVRIGYVVCDPESHKALLRVKQATDLHSSLPMQQLVLNTLSQTTMSQHLPAIRAAYANKRDRLVNALQDTFGDKARFTVPCGGMFLWVVFHHCDTEILAKRGLEEGVAIVPGKAFCPNAEQFGDAARLNFTHATAEQITAGVARLYRAYQASRI